MFFIYAEANRALVADFERNLGDEKTIRPDRNGEPPYDHWVVEGAEHVFSGTQTQEALIDGIVDWLNSGMRHQDFAQTEVTRVGEADAVSITSD